MRTLIAVAILLARQNPGPTAAVGGKTLELSAFLAAPDLLLPGDYRARLVSEHRESAYELRQSYEILLPDKRTRTFVVTGVQE